MKKSFLLKALAITSMAFLMGLQNASAIITFDLRAPVANGVGVASDGSKTVTVAAGASTVLLDLWVVVTGTDALPTNDGLLSIAGGMILSGGPALSLGGISLDGTVTGNTAISSVSTTLRGNLSNPGVTTTGVQQGLVAPWGTSSTSNGGVARDLNGDGFTDIGGTTSSTNGNGFINANAGATQNSASGLTPVTNFNLLANGVEFRIAQYNFTIANAVAGTSTGVNYGVQLFGSLANNARASWTRDGTVGQTGISANLAVAGVVNITAAVPEPSAFGMLALGALGLVGFRRMGLRRTA